MKHLKLYEELNDELSNRNIKVIIKQPGDGKLNSLNNELTPTPTTIHSSMIDPYDIENLTNMKNLSSNIIFADYNRAPSQVKKMIDEFIIDNIDNYKFYIITTSLDDISDDLYKYINNLYDTVINNDI